MMYHNKTKHHPWAPKVTIAILAVALLSTVGSSMKDNTEITALPGDDSHFIQQSVYTAILSSPFSDTSPSFTVKSNIPVSLLRYNVNAGSGGVPGGRGGMPIVLEGNEIRLYVKTNCPDKGPRVSVGVSHDNNVITGLYIKSDLMSDPPILLEDSHFSAEANVTSFLAECAKYSSSQSELPFNSGGSSLRMRSKGSDEEDELYLVSQLGSEICAVSAEILYDACFRPFVTTAPIVKVSDVDGEFEETQYDCYTNYQGNFNVTEVSMAMTGDTPVTTDKFAQSECRRVAPGRPYYDSKGHHLQSPATTTNTPSGWSPSRPTDDRNPPSLSSSVTNDVTSAWIERSVGEHASVASFAAVTISLMTHDAPPDLIRDSLRAALDEVDHAITSFRVASLLAGETIAPGPLPASTHDFQHNVGTLLERVFDDGCVDETLSALAAAVEAQEYATCTDGDCVIEGMLMKELRVIGLDEARHAALAWRTLRWACGVDAEACQRKIGGYLEEETDSLGLATAAQSGFPSLYTAFERQWKDVYRTLLPFVMGDGKEGDEEDFCKGVMSSDNPEAGAEEESFVDQVSRRIIHGVLCDGSTTAAAVQ